MNQPNSDATEPHFPDERIDKLADQFEKDWKAGGRPRIDDYLNRAGDLDHSALLRELIVLEWDLWLEAGQQPKLSDYLEQFPDDESIVREAVAFVEARRGEGLRDDEEQDESVPDMIDRYAVDKELGSGGFAKVFLAHDTELNRPVALKIPLKKYFKDEAAVRLFLQEAQTLASLNHPSLVTVFTCGRLPGGAVFIVQEFINGPNLRQWARSSSLSHEQIVRLLIEVSEAIAYVHQKKIWHRDLKPANILLDAEGRPHVADFGLALHERSRLLRRGERSGSPPYMAPEQVHGESHRIDGCTDIWALGVILYELLVRERPFQGADEQEILKKIVTIDPLPPRQIAPSVPRELERICLKCLQRRRSDRYLSVADLLDDLRHWLEGDGEISEKAQPSSTEEVKPRIIPKGLRSFDAHDADFFLDLLPGPRDRNGLPESLRFWKIQIEETDPDKSFAIGLIYGPSGCGKSSLVKAGLLPRLDDRVTTVYVEATPYDTEVRLAKGLRKRFPDLPEDLELPELFWHLRTASRRKLLIVLDQFEQWLHVRGSEQPSQLVEALRQCEAGRIQCVVLVRADFMMAITRFLDSLEAGLVNGGNAAAVDLFDPRHARHVLAEFGRAYGTLPENPGEMTEAQSQFLDEAVAELAEDERIICVKLALLAELVKGKPWTPGTIRDLGGFKGIGRKFLEETFESETAVPKHRFHQKAAEAALRALLPESDTDEIKGSRQSRETLLKATEEYIGREMEFDDVLQILDTELRLITPTDPEGSDADEERPPASEPKQRYYQLTHDYLVPSLREWLTRRQKETRRGRAELLLADRAAVWTARQENRQLPSLWQWLQIKTLTRRQTWKPREQKLMARAAKVHALRTLLTAVAFILLAWGSYEAYGRLQASYLVDRLLGAKTEEVLDVVSEMAPYRRWLDQRLEAAYKAVADRDPGKQLAVSLALLSVDPGQVDYLYGRLLNAEEKQATEVKVIRDALADQDQLLSRLWPVVESPATGKESQRLRAAAALAKYDEKSEKWATVEQTIANDLVGVSAVYAETWMELFRPIRTELVPGLSAVYRDASRREAERSLATDILADYAADQPKVLAELLMDADERQFTVIYPPFAEHGEEVAGLMRAEIARELKPKWGDAALDPSWTSPDASSVRQIQSAHGLIEERFAFCQTMSLDEFVQVAEKLRAAGYRPSRFRPYASGDSVQVAAVWTRDGRQWHLAPGLPADEIRKVDEELRAEGFMPVDAAGYVTTEAGKLVENYVAVWVKRADDHEDARLYVAAPYEEHKAIYAELEKAGFLFHHSLQEFRGSDGQQKYCGVKFKSDEKSTFTWNNFASVYEGKEYLDRTHWDIAVSNAPQTRTTEETYTIALAEAEEKLKAKPDDSGARYARAVANLYLGNDERALDDFTSLIEKDPTGAKVYQYRAMVHARMGKEEEANKDLAKFIELGKSRVNQAYVEAIVSAYLGQDEEGMKQLELHIQERSNDNGFLYDAACAYAIASRALSEDKPPKSKEYGERAVALLEETVAHGYDNYSLMQTDPDLDSIHDHSGYQDLLRKAQVDRRYAAVWNGGTEYESVESHGLLPQDHFALCKELVSQGYRPFGISVAAIGEGRSLVSASVWHRPLVSEEEKEEVAQRQANAAVALLRMGEEEEVWPLLKHDDYPHDPRVRSWIIHRLCPMGAGVNAIIARLREDRDDVSIRRALILTLGEYEDLAPADREPLVGTLLDMYRDNPDPGIHGAAEWLLRKWNQEETLREIDKPLATGELMDARQWYVNTQGQTMIVIPGPAEFLMGAPATEPDRYSWETPHRRKIGRSFAIATKEVTVEQFQKFLRANPGIRHNYTERFAPAPNCPQISVTWYEAAAYCRWLSEEEGIAQEQMCYPPVPEIKDGMRLPEDCLERTGYRLPTEAEWEYACRAGASTSRCYGQSDELLGRYGWYLDISNDRTWPVGTLKPNDFGLFDMYGNALEWCQDSYRGYPVGSKSTLSEEIVERDAVTDRTSRVLRGGSFDSNARGLRSANRDSDFPDDRSGNVGFRAARTYPLAP